MCRKPPAAMLWSCSTGLEGAGDDPVQREGEHIPDTTKQEAAELAVIHSSAYKAGTGAKVAVDTTEVKNIWKANGAKPGMVLYEVYTTVYITPRDGLEEQLKKK